MKWTPVDIIVLILAVTIAFTLMAVVLISVISGERLSPAGVTIIGRLMSAIIALVGVYIGNKMKKQE